MLEICKNTIPRNEIKFYLRSLKLENKNKKLILKQKVDCFYPLRKLEN